MVPVSISQDLKMLVPELTLSCIECDVLVQENTDALWTQIKGKTDEIAASLKVEAICRIPEIAASRQAYKVCGKEPARYRLSAEALLRRVVQGKGLYRINNVVDLLNLVSVSSGFSIGGYDAGKISGSAVFGIGKKDEPYEGIGRGVLNIESLPVFRDEKGAFGTPTSDSVRTSVTKETGRFLMVIIDYGSSEKLEEATTLAVSLLRKYANAGNIELKIIQ